MPKVTEAFPVITVLAASAAILAGCSDTGTTAIPAPAPVEHYAKNKERNVHISALAARFAKMILRREGSSDKSDLGSVSAQCYGPENPSTGAVNKVSQTNTKPGDFCKLTAVRDSQEWSYAIFNVDATGNYNPKNISGFMVRNYAGCTAEFSDDPEGKSNTLTWSVTDWDLESNPGGSLNDIGTPASSAPGVTGFSRTAIEAYNVDQAAFACLRATDIVLGLE